MILSVSHISSFRKQKLRWLKIEQRLVDLDIAVKTSLHLERPMPEDCITALDELNELALSPLMLKKQPDVVTTIRYVIIIIGSFRSSRSHNTSERRS